MTTIKQALGVAMLAAMALPTMAADLYAGGSTWASWPYVGIDYKSPSPEARLSTLLGNCALNLPFTCSNIASNSVFGTFSLITAGGISYAQTANGQAKSIFVGAMPTSPMTRDYSTTALGFTAPQVDYIATEAPLTVNDLTAFNTNVGPIKQAPVQIPASVGAIALPFRHDGIAATMNLAINDVCGIFRGTYTNWNQVPGFPAISKPITIVYRADNSGTSYAFSNWLAANCNIAQGGVSPDRSVGVAAFQTSPNFVVAVDTSWYAAAIATANNQYTVAAVNSFDGAIGYADPGDVGFAGGTYMTVNNFDPFAVSSPPFPNASMLVNMVLSNTAVPGTGLPSPSSAGGTVPAGSLMVLDPAYRIPAGSAYPIFALSYLDFYNRGQSSTGGVNNAPALRCLMNFIYNRTVSGCPTGRPTLPAGYSYVNDALFAAKVTVGIARITP